MGPAAPLAILAAVCVLCVFFYFYRNMPTQREPIRATSFKLNTVVTITIYDSTDEGLLAGCMDICDQYEAIFSRTDEDSELYRLNHRTLPAVEGAENTYLLSEELADLIGIGLKYCRASDGAFDITLEPLTSLWDFTSGKAVIPDKDDIARAVKTCGWEKAELNGRELTLSSPDTAFDLGGIAKGYIADRIKDYLLAEGVQSATIDLGGNVLCVGKKPDGKPFQIGLQKPFAVRNETLGVLPLEDMSLVSSGTYERYFEKEGILYHHILNPDTGFPYESDLTAVSILSENSVDGDALSTVCFALGLEEGMDFIESLDGVEALFVTEDSALHYSTGFPALG